MYRHYIERLGLGASYFLKPAIKFAGLARLFTESTQYGAVRLMAAATITNQML